MILNKKGEIIRFIRNNKRPRTKDIMHKYGNNGYVKEIVNILKLDDIIEEKKFDCGNCKYWVIKK